MKKIKELKAIIENKLTRSAWGKGVKLYALELLDGVTERAHYEGREPENAAEMKEWALNGAQNWGEYSWGGSALIYNSEISERLCCPSELKKIRNGERSPNAREEWLDVQARALSQACNLLTFNAKD